MTPDPSPPTDPWPGSDATRAFLDGDFDRYLLVANNPTIGRRTLDRLGIGPRDLVVQFNHCLHFAALAERPGAKAFVVNRTITDHPGFCVEGRPHLPFDRLPGRAAAMIFVTGDPPKPDGPTAAWLAAAADRLATLVPERGRGHDEIPDYPKGKRPSTGFRAILLLRWVNRQRAAAGRAPIPIHLVGFTMRGIPMHGWAYERAWLADHPEIRRHSDRLQVPKRLWWWLVGKKLEKLRRRGSASTGRSDLPIGRA